MSNFIKLEDLLLPAPLSAVMAVLIVAGLAHLGWRLALRICRERATGLDFAGGFILVTACTAGLVHGLAMAQLSTINVLRVGGWALAAAGAYEMVRHGRSRLAVLVAAIRKDLSELHWVGRAGLMLACLCALCLVLAALGPPTDADSLDYHLGVPLDWLRHGGAYPRSDWLHARLAGLGEALNMLGLASGTDVLGALLQASGLFVVTATVAGMARGADNRVFAILITLTTPVLLSLVPTQKPQLLPVAASTLGLVILVSRADKPDLWALAVAFGSVAFSMGCKYSFLITGGVVMFAGLAIAWRRNMLRVAMIVAMVALAVLVVPLMVRNTLFHGDPISPLLENIRAHPDPEVVAFAKHLRDRGGERSLVRFLLLPFEFGATIAPGLVSTVLGLGVFALITIGRLQTAGWWLVICSIVAMAPLLADGQLAARFFLEPYLWIASAVVATEWTRSRGVLFRALVLQAFLMACIAGYGAVSLFPGSLSVQLRDSVMRSAANNYAEARWLDKVLPADSIILTRMRSRALLPRPFVSYESYLPGIASEYQREKLCKLIVHHGVTAAIFDPSLDNLVIESVRNPRILAGPKTFQIASRNPWNAGSKYSVQVYDVGKGCQ